MSPKHKQPSAANVEEASRWLAFARGDIETARAFLGSTAVPNRNTAYMAQQAAEKAMKAVVLLDNLPFEMTHDLAAIQAQAPSDFSNPASTMDLAWLADIETLARYPDEGDTVTIDDAERAVGIANAILTAAAGHFAARGVDESVITAG